MFDDLKFRFANAKRVSEFPDRASELVVMAQQADRLTGEQRDIISAFFADLEYLRVEIPAIITALEARLDEVMRNI